MIVRRRHPSIFTFEWYIDKEQGGIDRDLIWLILILLLLPFTTSNPSTPHPNKATAHLIIQRHMASPYDHFNTKTAEHSLTSFPSNLLTLTGFLFFLSSRAGGIGWWGLLEFLYCILFLTSRDRGQWACMCVFFL